MKFPSGQHGLTLLELSLALVVIGLITALLASLLPALSRTANQQLAINDVTDADHAMTGFALVAGRFPCADTNFDGVEDCPAVVGSFPYVTLGLGAPLRNAQGFDYRYAVYSRPDTVAMNDVALTRSIERWQPDIVAGLPPAAQLANFAQLSHLDICRAVAVGQDSAVNTDYLHVVSSGAREHIAYALINPGSADSDNNGSVFDGLNGAGLALEHPARAADNQYDDRVSVGYFTDVWARLGCAGLLSAAGHAHPNVESMVAMMRQSLRDYRDQLELTEDMAFADNFQAGASIASSAAGVAAAAATAPTASASAINTMGATAAAVGASVTAIALNATATGLAGAVTAVTAINHQQVLDQLDELDELIEQLDDLHRDIQPHVREADLDALSGR